MFLAPVKLAIMLKKSNSLHNWIWIVLIILVADQATKLMAENMLQYLRPVEIMPMFNLTLVYNQGAAFSFLSEAGGWQRWFFMTLSFVISIVLVVWLTKLKPHQRLQTIALALILGGALGNLIDRSIYGHVIDFIDIYYNTFHWPAFNIADSAISVGAVLIIVDSFRHQHTDTKPCK